MVPGVVIMGVAFLNPELRYLAVAMMCVTAAFHSACMSGFRLNHLDIAPRSARSGALPPAPPSVGGGALPPPPHVKYVYTRTHSLHIYRL